MQDDEQTVENKGPILDKFAYPGQKFPKTFIPINEAESDEDGFFNFQDDIIE